MTTNGYPVTHHQQPTKRYVQTMSLKDNPQLIALYKQAHSKEHIWKEIIEGIKSVGILTMDIYLLGTRLVMIVDTPIDFQWKEAMTKLSTLPRQAEWEAHVAQFQLCDCSMRSDEKWQLMEQIFRLYE